jgi:hypothetical protein
MASWVLALLIGLGGGAWTWNKAIKSTGSNQTALIIGTVVGIIIFIVLFTLMKLF